MYAVVEFYIDDGALQAETYAQDYHNITEAETFREKLLQLESTFSPQMLQVIQYDPS